MLSSPDRAFQKIKEKPKVYLGMIFILSGWLNFFISLLLFSKIPISLFQCVFLFFLTGTAIVLLISLKTMWLHFWAEILGGEGRVTSLFVLSSCALFPFHFSLPITLIAQKYFPFLIVVGWIGIAIWSGALGFKAIRENYTISRTKSTFVAFSPAIFLFICALILLSFLVGIMASALSSLLSMKYFH